MPNRRLLVALVPCIACVAACLPAPTPPPPVDVAVIPAQPDAAAPMTVTPAATEDASTAPREAALARTDEQQEDDGAPTDDPARGKFTLDEATDGLAAGGALVATIKTTQGNLRCTLYEDKAPNTVANFVGLARGLRPWKDPTGQWVKRPAYDGTTFHRVIKGFMIQGGDPKGNGTGEPGYTIADEPWKGAKHDRAGLLCMANRGANTNGSQFFITDASTPHLDGPGNAYTIFGECTPVSIVRAIASVPKSPSGDRPLNDVTISTVEITRAPPVAKPKRP